MEIIIIILWLFLSLIAANMASNKGNSGIVVFIASIILSPIIGFLIAMIDRPNQTVLDKRGIKSGRLKRCLYCAELVKSKALICRYCNKEFPLL